MWCKMVIRSCLVRQSKIFRRPKRGRLSVTLTSEQLRRVEALARKNRVSVAWVIREAIDRLLRDDAPLFHLNQL